MNICQNSPVEIKLAGELLIFPHYLAGSWSFAHPGCAEHLFFFQQNQQNRKKCFISVFL